MLRKQVVNILKTKMVKGDAKILEKAMFDSLGEKNYDKHCFDILGVFMDDTFDLNLDEKVSKIQITSYKPFQFFPYSSLIADRQVKNIRETRPTKITDGAYKCKKCGNKKIVMYSLQLRSADEPMTNFFTCTMCGKKWKQ